jgi:hypothetical protein
MRLAYVTGWGLGSGRMLEPEVENTARVCTGFNRRVALWTLSGGLLTGCRSARKDPRPSIQFTRIPQADPAGQEKNDIIEGVVNGDKPGQQIVLYALTGKWWLQPLRTQPFTKINNHSKWTNATHLGSEYAALLVEPGFHPPFVYDELPARGGGILAVESVNGQKTPPSKTISFSGYEWRVRDAPSSRGGFNLYDPSNVWTDDSGAMHLRITNSGRGWTCAETSLVRNLGYGTYRFVVRDISHLPPSLVFSMFTWDYAGGPQGNREMDIEITRWGEPSKQNAQFSVQPFYLAANTMRFEAPPGTLTHSLRWEPAQASFRTVRGAAPHAGATVAEHVFTSGVPSPGIESARMNHYIFHDNLPMEASESEVVVERFEYLP